jgi:hypothetical protein
MTSIVTATDFNTDKLTLTAPKVLPNANGARQSYTNYNSGKFYVQTPKNMSVPFGLDVFRDEKSGNEAYSMNVSLRGYDSDPEIKAYYELLKKVDDLIISEAYKNRKTWFPKNKDISEDTIRTLYKSPLKESFDDEGNMKYPPVHKIKFKKDKEGSFEAKFWNESRQAIKDKSIQELIVKGVSLSVIVRCSGITFAGTGFSSSWVAEQVMIHKLPESLSGFAFQGFGSAPAFTESSHSNTFSNQINDDDVLSAVMPSAPVASVPTPASNPFESLSDQEDDDDDDDATEEPPMPAPKKTTVVKKTVVKKVAAK